PVQHAYTTFQCWYKATLAGSDAFIVTVVMYDDSLHAIGSADIAIRTSTSTFTMLTIPIDYPVHSDVSTCIIQFIAADTNGAVVAHNGTSFVVDDVELTGLSSIADLPLLNTVQVFPNPAHDQIFISAEGYFAGTVSLILTNMQGREVYRNEVFHSGQPERKMEVNLPDLPSGIYFLNIRKGEAFATQKLMIVDCL
ncbi:MAG TPA: T9SS type A sorting domain-containing protein, partial [Bacteroidia bacterium]|nr:T9SS type A sorting domain-containing protein [Bacteroidia bacterium]